MPRFVDTNVLLYAISGDPDEQSKKATALEILRSPDLVLSAQVLAEFFVQATRPSRNSPVPRDDAIAFLETLTVFPIQPVTTELVRTAISVQERFGISYWDSQIVAAARIQRCSTLLSEDLSAGQDYDGVTVTNPFA